MHIRINLAEVYTQYITSCPYCSKTSKDVFLTNSFLFKCIFAQILFTDNKHIFSHTHLFRHKSGMQSLEGVCSMQNYGQFWNDKASCMFQEGCAVLCAACRIMYRIKKAERKSLEGRGGCRMLDFRK